MTQTIIQLPKGAHPDLATQATDATSLTAGTVAALVIPTGITRAEAAQACLDIRSRILDDIHTTAFPT